MLFVRVQGTVTMLMNLQIVLTTSNVSTFTAMNITLYGEWFLLIQRHTLFRLFMLFCIALVQLSVVTYLFRIKCETWQLKGLS